MTFLSKEQIEQLSLEEAKTLLAKTIKKYRVDGKTINPDYWSILDDIVNQVLYLEDYIFYQERYMTENASNKTLDHI
jgi:hypothetical protein